VADCFLNPMKVAEKVYPLSNETERATVLFYKLHNRTGHVLTGNQSNEVYTLFKAYFKVPNQRALMDQERAILACVKWYRFSVVTMTTIGFGVVTAKTSVGRLLVIPYALVTIPLMMWFLRFVGSLISKWAESTMLLVHRCIKGDKPMRHKLLKRCMYTFITFWILCVIVMGQNISAQTSFKSTGAMRWLDGFYFLLVTFSTVGFGDITGPAQNPVFFLWNFVAGLAAVSGFTDSFLSLIDRIEFTSKQHCPYCCIQYKADDVDETAIIVDGGQYDTHL